MVETYLKMVYPMKKYNMVPSYSLVEHMFSCGTAVTPPNFYDKVREGSLILKKAREFRFSENGLILDDGEKDEILVASEIVIFATGYKPDEKLKNIFSLAYFQKCIIASSAPFYRECIHPRIPNLAIPGYADSPANIYTTEMKCRWLAHFLAGKYFKLPSIREMEQDVILWEKFKRRYAGSNYKRQCASALLQIYANDQLCYDMGYNPIRKSCFFSNFFAPYGPADYNFQSPDYNIHERP